LPLLGVEPEEPLFQRLLKTAGYVKTSYDLLDAAFPRVYAVLKING